MNSIELAIGLELDNKRFYMEQAEKTDDNGLKSIFHTLAEEESIHARILKNKAETLPYELIDTYGEIKSIYLELGKHKNVIKKFPDAVDTYNLALQNEKKSLELYSEMLRDAADEKEKKIFSFLVEQENSHYHVIEQLIEMVSRPAEWVESAEFGLRKEY
ncbi:MAG TPA: ferritin family protein [Anaerovoracaceae bacterium]|nr:ferritin family protein [Anaerovoracaceae bacterium]